MSCAGGHDPKDPTSNRAPVPDYSPALRQDINRALGVGMGKSGHANVEAKYGGPEGVIIDVSETGWVGTSEER